MNNNIEILKSIDLGQNVQLQVIHDKEINSIVLVLKCNFRISEKYEILCNKLRELTGDDWKVIINDDKILVNTLISNVNGFERLKIIDKIVSNVLNKLNKINIVKVIESIKRMKIKKVEEKKARKKRSKKK